MMISIFSFTNQFFVTVQGEIDWWEFFLQINNLSKGYNIVHLDQWYVLAWLCHNIVRCNCIVMLFPHSSVMCFYCVMIWAIYRRIKSLWCDCLPKTTVHCQLHWTQRVYSFKATSSAFGCNRQSLRSRSDIVHNLQSLKVESGRGQ
jgi:hypothetical protein